MIQKMIIISLFFYRKGELRFQNGSGNLKIRLICDCFWFSILDGSDDSFNEQN